MRVIVRFGETLLDLHDQKYPAGPRSSKRAEECVGAMRDWTDTWEVPAGSDVRWGEWMIQQCGDGVVQPPTDSFADLLYELDGIEGSNRTLADISGKSVLWVPIFGVRETAAFVL